MALVRQPRDLGKYINDSSILEQYIVPYTLSSNSFYKHIDEVKLEDGKVIKLTMSPTDISIVPYEGFSINVISKTNRIDVLATKYYGKASLWRAIAYMNKIADPLKLYIGQPIGIPNIEGLRKFPNPLS